MHSAPCVKEIFVACVFAGTGMICAGTYLDWMKSKFAESLDSRLIAIIPPLIGLKGNLEVTLSSRLSTLINLKTSVNKQFFQVFFSTLVYILIQAVIAGCAISIICVSLFPENGKLWSYLQHVEHLTTVSVLTCCFSICGLSSLVFGLVICCLLLGMDPDNVAPPAAAALGDLATVTILLRVNEHYATAPITAGIIAIVLASLVLVLGALYLKRQIHSVTSADLQHLSITQHTFISSVGPLFGAIIMSSLSGQVLAYFAHRLPNLARLQIAINGVGGCFGSVVISRMITKLHAQGKKVVSPPIDRKCPISDPFVTSVVSTPHESHWSIPETSDGLPCPTLHLARTVQSTYQAAPEVEEDANYVSRFILWACVPIHFFLALISIGLYRWLNSDEDSPSQLRSVFAPSTLVAYLLAGFMQIFVVLKFAKWIVLRYWRYLLMPRSTTFKDEPWGAEQTPSLAPLDLAAIALTTGLGDLIGSVFLVLMLHLLQS